jgi:hypothetical protein
MHRDFSNVFLIPFLCLMLIVLAIDYFMQLELEFYLFFMIPATFSGIFVVIYASLHSIIHFKVAEAEKSEDRRLLERKVSFGILALWVIGLFIYFLYSENDQLRDSITGLMLAIGSGLYAKLLEKEFSLPSSVKYKAKETAFIIGLGILCTSIYYLTGSKEGNYSGFLTGLSLVGLSLSPSILFISISEFIENKYKHLTCNQKD